MLCCMCLFENNIRDDELNAMHGVISSTTAVEVLKDCLKDVVIRISLQEKQSCIAAYKTYDGEYSLFIDQLTQVLSLGRSAN